MLYYRFSALLSVFLSLLVPLTALATDDKWAALRSQLFADRPLSEGKTAQSIVQLAAPYRAEDAAIVPITISTQMVQQADRYIKYLYLIIDKNPVPIAAKFTLTPLSGRADIATRVRVDSYTYVRVIAEMNNGELYMDSKFVKASGGCSAPVGKDMDAALARLGKMRLRMLEPIADESLIPVQLMVSHPNNSGLQMDQVSRLYTSAHFVQEFKVMLDDQLILSAETNISISEDPNFHFYMRSDAQGTALKAEVVDSDGQHFSVSRSLKLLGSG